MQTLVPFAALAAGAIPAAGAPGRSPSGTRPTSPRSTPRTRPRWQQNDVATMDRILADDFVLVLGTGSVHDKAELPRGGAQQRASPGTAAGESTAPRRCACGGDTAVVTAKLRVKGTRDAQGVRSYALVQRHVRAYRVRVATCSVRLRWPCP